MTAAASLSLFTAVEFCLWDAWDDQTNFQRNLNTGEVEVDGSTIFHLTEYRERRDHFAYFACSEELAGFDTSRDAFLGPYRGWDRPVVVETGRATDSVAHGWAPIGSHQVALTLAPGETREVRFVLGYFENPRRLRSSTSGRLNQALVRPGDRSVPRRATWSRRRSALCVRAGRSCSTGCRSRRRTSTSTAWSTPGTPTSAWSRSTCRGRRRTSSRASAAAWASATAAKTCSASCRWCRHGRASASSTSRRRSSSRAARITSTNRSRSAATTRSARASTTTRCGSCSRSPRT